MHSTVRFSALAVLLTSLLPLGNACLIFQGNTTPAGGITVNLLDNDKWVCTWSGAHVSGRPEFMVCISGFASWIQVTDRGSLGPKVVCAYAHDGMSFRFDVQTSGTVCSLPPTEYSRCASNLSARMKGCPAARVTDASVRGVAPTPPVGKLGDVVGAVGWVQGQQVSTTANVVGIGAKTAGVAIVPSAFSG